MLAILVEFVETESGEQRFGENRFTACQLHDEECWVYSAEGLLLCGYFRYDEAQR